MTTQIYPFNRSLTLPRVDVSKPKSELHVLETNAQFKPLERKLDIVPKAPAQLDMMELDAFEDLIIEFEQ